MSYSELFVKVAYLKPTHLHLTPLLRVMLLKFRQDLWHQKTKVHGLSCGVVSMTHV